MKMIKGYWEEELTRRYGQCNEMFHEIALFLEDEGMIACIGNKTFIEFDRDVLIPVARIFHPTEHKEVWKYRGHRVSLIRFYCDMFNGKVHNE